MDTDIETLKREAKRLPPLARRRAGRELGLPAAPAGEHKVFVYGTLLTGEGNARWARDARRQRAWTTGTIYEIGRGFPAFEKKGTTRVVGEVLTADDEAFASMDRLEGYPRLYRREKILCHLEGGGCVSAWVYVMNRLPDCAKPIECGDWRKFRRGLG